MQKVESPMTATDFLAYFPSEPLSMPWAIETDAPMHTVEWIALSGGKSPSV